MAECERDLHAVHENGAGSYFRSDLGMLLKSPTACLLPRVARDWLPACIAPSEDRPIPVRHDTRKSEGVLDVCDRGCGSNRPVPHSEHSSFHYLSSTSIDADKKQDHHF